METQEIPPADWQVFFDSFSRQHEAWLATLEVFGADIGAQEEARELPFTGITLESDLSGTKTITIDLGELAGDHISHSIREPTHVWLRKTREGADEALEIESADDNKTLLRFRSAVLPEMVDGVVL
jgi:Family of unknown function (DUF5335)